MQVCRVRAMRAAKCVSCARCCCVCASARCVPLCKLLCDVRAVMCASVCCYVRQCVLLLCGGLARGWGTHRAFAALDGRHPLENVVAGREGRDAQDRLHLRSSTRVSGGGRHRGKQGVSWALTISCCSSDVNLSRRQQGERCQISEHVQAWLLVARGGGGGAGAHLLLTAALALAMVEWRLVGVGGRRIWRWWQVGGSGVENGTVGVGF